MELNLEFHRLSKDHCDLIKKFRTGDFAFDQYLETEAFNDQDNGDGVTYVILNNLEGQKEIVSYFTLSSFSIPYYDKFDLEDDTIPIEEKEFKLCAFSAIKINMFAVNERFQNIKKGKIPISAMIFKYVISLITKMSKERLGAKVIMLYSVPKAIDFYKKNEFHELEEYMTAPYDAGNNDCTPMYLPLY